MEQWVRSLSSPFFLEELLLKELVEIGYIKKAHGIKGEVLLALYDEDFSFLDKGIKLRLKSEVYKILKMRPHKEGLILLLEGVSDRNTSEGLKGKKVSLSNKIFENLRSKSELYLNQLKNYSVVNSSGDTARVVGFAETKAHDLLILELKNGGQGEIPYVEKFIFEINHEEQKIFTDCPAELFKSGFLNSSKKES